jgi:hypothetical protein
VCGTKNFVSVRLYSAPQSHWTIVTIHGICAFGEPAQAESFAAIKSDSLPGLGTQHRSNGKPLEPIFGYRSILKPPKHLALPCHRRCSHAPTR